MSYRMEVVKNPDFLHIRLYGILNRKKTRQIIDDFAFAINGSSHRRVLVDYRALDLEMTFLDYYEHISYAARQLYAHTCRVSFLVNKETYDISPFFASVATNRGLQLQYFYEEQSAIEWLTGETRPK